MLYECISLALGIIKLLIYKALYSRIINFQTVPKCNYNIKLAIKRKGKLIVGRKIRTRNNVSFRIYNQGIVSIGNNAVIAAETVINKNIPDNSLVYNERKLSIKKVK